MHLRDKHVALRLFGRRTPQIPRLPAPHAVFALKMGQLQGVSYNISLILLHQSLAKAIVIPMISYLMQKISRLTPKQSWECSEQQQHYRRWTLHHVSVTHAAIFFLLSKSTFSWLILIGNELSKRFDLQHFNLKLKKMNIKLKKVKISLKKINVILK